ncbi:MAG: ferrous iron transport protein B [Chitinophagaceae bacterium]|nr:ferrous iron transport protein B [Chitinophagaceae bacterium]
MSLKKNINIALVGNPNSGKSSLFNVLTGLNQKVGNFPGVTVDKKTGRCMLSENETANIIDLPGTYSLYPKSDDEVVTFDVLFDDDEAVKIDIVIVVVDASNLKRNLLFCSQIMDIKKPVVVALTMMDIARQKGIQIDVNGLSRELGYPVLTVNPRKEKGTAELKKQLLLTARQKYEAPGRDFIDNYELAHEVVDIVKRFYPVSSNYSAIHFASAFHKLTIISKDQKAKLEQELNRVHFNKTKIQAEETLLRYARIRKIMQACVVENDPLKKELFSRQADKILLHPIYGNVILLVVLFLLFQSVFWLAQYPMDGIDMLFGKFTAMLKTRLPEHFLSDLLTNGILAGISGIVMFIPQIMILFGLITLLEDSGYMSRISFLTDRLMRSVGLNGKSVMPMISAVACAVPAIMAARTIENKKEKLITILITPFMSCSARLPVYTILISLVIPKQMIWGVISLQGLVMMALYLAGFLMALLAAYILNFFIQVKERSIFLMELPVYRMPRWKNAGMTMIQKARVFAFDAGKVILLISIILWGLSSYGPNHAQTGAKRWISHTTLDESYAGIMGKAIEPAIRPIGFDWKIGIALITSFAAREVFVGTMATLYSVDGDDEQTLKQKMAAAVREDGTKVYTLRTGLSLLTFYVFAMQCMSTLAIVKRETGHWKYPILQFLFMGATAYLFSFLIYHLFS